MMTYGWAGVQYQALGGDRYSAESTSRFTLGKRTLIPSNYETALSADHRPTFLHRWKKKFPISARSRITFHRRPTYYQVRKLDATFRLIFYVVCTVHHPTTCIQTNKMYKILVIRLYFLLDVLHVSDYVWLLCAYSQTTTRRIGIYRHIPNAMYSL